MFLLSGLKRLDQFFFQKGIRQVDQFSGGDHHDIHVSFPQVLMAPEDFPDFPFGPVSDHRIADFSRSDDSQTFAAQLVGKKKKGAGAIHRLFPALVQYAFEIGAGQQPFIFRKRLVRHDLSRQTFASFASAVGQYPASSHSGLAGPEPMGPFSS